MNMNNDYSVHVDQERCIQCRLCAIECPSQTADPREFRSDQYSIHCDRCFHCYAICPQNAIRVEGFREEEIASEWKVGYKELLPFLKQRRSIRRFEERPVPVELLYCLTDAAKYSPTGGNAQDLSITIINHPDTRKELEDAIIKYYNRIIRLLGNPLVRLLMRYSGDAKVKETAKDREFFRKIGQIYSRMKSGEKNIFYDAPVVMLFHTDRLLPTALEDCILAAYNVVLAAGSLDLGSCFVSLSQQAISSSRKIKTSLGMPPGDRIHAVLVLGFPAAYYRRVPPRNEKNIWFR